MPDLNNTSLEEIESIWHKNPGDYVNKKEVLVKIETKRKTTCFLSFYEGMLLYTGIKEGQLPSPGELLAIVGPKGTSVSKVIELYHKLGASKITRYKMLTF